MTTNEQFLTMLEYFANVLHEVVTQASEARTDEQLLEVQDRVIREGAILQEGIQLACENDEIDCDQYGDLITIRCALHDTFIGCAKKMQRIRYD